MQGQCGPQPSITTAAQALDLNCKGLVDQVYDSVSAVHLMHTRPL